MGVEIHRFGEEDGSKKDAFEWCVPLGIWPFGNDQHAFNAVMANLIDDFADERPWWVCVGSQLCVPWMIKCIFSGGKRVRRCREVTRKLMIEGGVDEVY